VDESTKTIGKRLQSIGVENSEANRQAYRGLLFTTKGLGDYISGAILYEETLYQNNVDGTPFVKNLNSLGVIPGIKVDMGLQPLPGGHPVETWCTGLDGLVERAQKYYDQGARFAKWRAVLQITGDGAPTQLSVEENAWGLARYARAVQEGGLVPIVEPEILMDGDHSIERTAEVQERVLATVYKYLNENGVFLEGSLLKPSMTLPGADCGETVTSDKIAEYTVRTLERTVPPAVPGVMFLVSARILGWLGAHTHPRPTISRGHLSPHIHVLTYHLSLLTYVLTPPLSSPPHTHSPAACPRRRRR
jgi:fructose-bisphosphate aldolase, class I